MKCIYCELEGKQSVVFVGPCTTTCIASHSFYDEEGRWHDHDPNGVTTTFTCSQGHSWTHTELRKCVACEQAAPKTVNIPTVWIEPAPVWVVGRLLDPEPWDLLGVYSTEQQAIARCRTPCDFIGPVYLDRDLPDETVPWPGSYCPLAQEQGDGISA